MTKLDELEALHRAATPARWKIWGMSVMWDKGGDSDVARAQKVANTFMTNENGSPRTFDANLICALRNACPAILEAIRAAQELRGPHVSGVGLVNAQERFDAAMARLEER